MITVAATPPYFRDDVRVRLLKMASKIARTLSEARRRTPRKLAIGLAKLTVVRGKKFR